MKKIIFFLAVGNFLAVLNGVAQTASSEPVPVTPVAKEAPAAVIKSSDQVQLPSSQSIAPAAASPVKVAAAEALPPVKTRPAEKTAPANRDASKKEALKPSEEPINPKPVAVPRAIQTAPDIKQ